MKKLMVAVVLLVPHLSWGAADGGVEDKNTALFYAASRGDTPRCENLIAAGAKIDFGTRD